MVNSFSLSLIIFLFLQLPLCAQRLETVIQKGHNAAVKAVAVHPTGLYCITGSRDKSAILWDLPYGREIRTFAGHNHTVNAADFSKDGKKLITSCADGIARIWDITSGKLLLETPAENKYMTDVAFSPTGNYFITAGYFDQIKIYDLSGKILKSIETNADQGSGYGVNITFSNDGSLLAVGEDNRTVKIYNTSDWSLKQTIKPSAGWCGGCGTIAEISPDNKFLLKLSHNAGIEEYEIATGNLLWDNGEKYDGITGIYYAGEYIVAGNEKEISVIKRSDKKVFHTTSVRENVKITEFTISSDYNHIIAGCDNNTTVIFTLPDLKQTGLLKGIINEKESGIDYDPNNYWQSHIAKYLKLKNEIEISKSGKHLYRSKTETTLSEWEIASGLPVKEFNAHNKAVITFDISQDEKYIVTGDAEGKAAIWTGQGILIHEINAHRHPILSARFSPDGSQFTLSSWDATMSIWDTKTGKNISRIDLSNSSAFALSYSPDGIYLAAGRLGKTFELWEPDTKTAIRTFTGHTDVVSSICFHPTNKTTMISSSWDGSVRAWDINTGLMTKKYKDHSGPVHACLFSQDGKQIYSAGEDRIIIVRDYESGKIIRRLEGHKSEVTNLCLSESGKILASISIDGMVKLWNAEKGEEFYEHIHLGGKDWMAKTSEGYFNGTDKAFGYVHFVRELEVVSSEQMLDRFYRPDLLKQLNKTRGESFPVKKAEDILKQSPPPTIKVSALPLSGTSDAEVYIKITNNGGGIDEIKFLHNGKRIPLPSDWKSNIPERGTTITIKENVSLVHGYNQFEVSGYSKERIESAPSTAEIFSETGDKNSICHVFAVGIDIYKNPSLQLNYARDDAEAFAGLIKEKAPKLFKNVVVHELYDKDATKKNILDTLVKLAQTIRKNDVFIFFYAGHGSMADEKFYFIPVESTRLYDPAILNKEAIEAGILQHHLREIKALKQIVIMDACHSGGSVELLAARGSSEEKAIAQLSRSAGIHILASSSEDQTSKEVKELGHGIFTYLLLNALKGEADGSPKDGKITVFELKSYLDDQTPELNKKYSGKPQYPFTFSRGQDFPIIID
ncbi:MAG: caspase family protein [Cytophagaceae bacterium]